MSQADAILIFLDNTDPVCVDSLLPLLKDGASLIIIRNAKEELSKEELLTYHYLNGFDLNSLPHLNLRDIVLIQAKDHSSTDFHMAYLWNTESSIYNIDAVRIPWEKLGGPTDSRNNPSGKNPTNVWKFEEDRPKAKTLSLFAPNTSAEEASITYSSFGFGTNALIRLIRAHSAESGSIFLHAPEQDLGLFETTIQSQNRQPKRLSLAREMTIPEIANLSVLSGETNEKPATIIPEIWKKGNATAQLWLGDCRHGIPQLPANSVTHAITSPPYNISYSPFNVDTKDHSGNTQNPNREAYEDNLSPEEYQQLLASTFQAIDQVASEDNLDVFVNIKNNYQNNRCLPPFYFLALIPERWKLINLLIWEYDISFDPAPKKYKPQYEWILHLGYGKKPKTRALERWYISIQKGNSEERKGLIHPAIFPYVLVEKALHHSRAKPETSFVIDPFVGSGTVLKTCLLRSISCAGFEKNERFASDIRLRMRTYQEVRASET